MVPWLLLKRTLISSWTPKLPSGKIFTMKAIPESRSEAETILLPIIHEGLGKLLRSEFVRVWWALSYLNPGLHPDGYDADGSGWPSELAPFADEAWHRFEAGELSDKELYPADAAWAAIYDGMETDSLEESERRETLRTLRLPFIGL